MSTGNSLEVATSTVVCLKVAVLNKRRALLSVGGCHEVQLQNRKKGSLIRNLSYIFETRSYVQK